MKSGADYGDRTTASCLRRNLGNQISNLKMKNLQNLFMNYCKLKIKMQDQSYFLWNLDAGTFEADFISSRGFAKTEVRKIWKNLIFPAWTRKTVKAFALSARLI